MSTPNLNLPNYDTQYAPLGQGTNKALGWQSVIAAGAVAAKMLSGDVSVSSGSTSITSAGGNFTAAMNGQYFWLKNGGPVLVNTLYAWEASPHIGTFTYVSSTQGTLSAAPASTVSSGTIVIGPDSTAAINAAVALGRGHIPPNTSLIVTGEIVVGTGQHLEGSSRHTSRIYSVIPNANVVTSALAVGPRVRSLTIFGNGYGQQPTNTDPGAGNAPNWANSGCGIIYAQVTNGLIEDVAVYHCGGDAVTSGRNGIAGIYLTMGCITTNVVNSATTYCRNGINEDNFFSGGAQAYNPLSNTYDRNVTNYCRFGLAIDSGSLARGASITNHIARYNVVDGIDVHSTNYVTIVNPRCEYNGVGLTGPGITIYGTSSTIQSNYITVIGANCYANGTHGIKVSDYVTDWKIIGGSLAKNFRHGIYVNNQANDGKILGALVRANGIQNDVTNGDGVRITSSLRIDVDVSALDDQTTPTQMYGVRADGSSDYIILSDTTKSRGSVTAPFSIVGTNSRIGARTPASILAIAQGFQGESFARSAGTGSWTGASGDQRAILVPLKAGQVVAGLYEHVTVVGANLTIAKLGIWDTTGTLLASTANLTTQFTTIGVQGGALSSAWTCPADGGYYIGHVFYGSASPTIPTVRGTSGTTGYSGQAGTGAPPSISNASKTDIGAFTISSSGTAPWVAWS